MTDKSQEAKSRLYKALRQSNERFSFDEYTYENNEHAKEIIDRATDEMGRCLDDELYAAAKNFVAVYEENDLTDPESPASTDTDSEETT